jgi:hypothetical protein
MILPQLSTRKLDDLDHAENPFRVYKTTEKMLVFREKQRELEQLESIKTKIEHKYMHGQDLMNSLSRVGSLSIAVDGPEAAGNLSQDRTGMIR